MATAEKKGGKPAKPGKGGAAPQQQPKKAKLLYSVSQTVMQETFDQPRSQAIVPRTRAGTLRELYSCAMTNSGARSVRSACLYCRTRSRECSS